MTPLDSQHDDDESSEGRNQVSFLGHLISPQSARELEQFLEEAGGKIEPQKLADSIKIAEDGTVSIVWEGDMKLRETNVTRLPSNLSVHGTLDLHHCKKLTTLPQKLWVSKVLDIGHCTALTEIPEGLTALGGIWADYCHNLRSFPHDLTTEKACSLYQCYFGLDVEMFKRIYRLKASGRLSISAIGRFVPVPFDLNMTQEAFLRFAISNDEKAAHFFLDHFSEFSNLPTAENLGMMTVETLESPLANLNWAFLHHPDEEILAPLRDYFDTGENEPSETLLNHAELVLIKGIENTKLQTIHIEEQFKECKGNKESQTVFLNMMRQLLPRNKLILQTILSRKILQRLAARNTSNDAIAFLLP